MRVAALACCAFVAAATVGTAVRASRLEDKAVEVGFTIRVDFR